MISYWYKFIKTLLLRKFKTSIEFNETISRTFRVRLFDCDLLGNMAAFKYPSYMDLIRWELIVRSSFFLAFKNNKLASVVASQKIIYQKPLKAWSKFNLTLELGGWDEKWVYHIHKFEQDNQLKAIGVTRIFLRKKDVPGLFDKIATDTETNLIKSPPEWIIELFKEDKEILKDNQPNL